MDGRRCRRRRPRRFSHAAPSTGDTAVVHTRLSDATPLELQAHVSRVACCAVITDTPTPLRRRGGAAWSQPHVCVVSGDAVGNLSIFYLSVSDLCAKTQSNDDEEAAQRLRIRPDVRFRGAHRGSINWCAVHPYRNIIQARSKYLTYLFSMRHIENTPMLLTGGDDGAVRLWNVEEERASEGKLQCIQEFLFHSSCVLACDMDPSQTFIATTGLDCVIALWLLGVPVPLLTISVSEPCFDVYILPQDPTLIQVTHHDRVSVWDIRTQPHYLHFQRALLTRVRERLAQSSANHTKTPLELLQHSFTGDDTLSWVQLSRKPEASLSRIQAKGGSTSSARATIYDEDTRRFVHPFIPHSVSAQLVRAQPTYDGRTILTSATDHAHKLWNVRTHQGIASFELPGQFSDASAATDTSHSLVAAGTLCHQERFLYGADTVGNVHVWDLRRAITSLNNQANAVVQPIKCLRGHSFFVTSIALSHNDTVLVTGDASGKIHVRIAM